MSAHNIPNEQQPGEGFAFFRWHGLKWGWLHSECRYSTRADCCAYLWDRVHRHIPALKEVQP